MDEIGLGKDDEAGLGLNDAHGLGWYDEQGLADAEPPITSIRSTSLQPYKKQKQLASEHARLNTYTSSCNIQLVSFIFSYFIEDPTNNYTNTSIKVYSENDLLASQKNRYVACMDKKMQSRQGSSFTFLF